MPPLTRLDISAPITSRLNPDSPLTARPDASPVARRASPFSPPVCQSSIKIGGLSRKTNIDDLTLIPGDGSEFGSSWDGMTGAHSMEEIQETPRASGLHRQGRSEDDLGEQDDSLGPLPKRTIPSIWMSSDPKASRPPPESPSRLHRLKGFTKRYSMSLSSFSPSKKFMPNRT
ncbi:hypothetical protein GGG16DRAFT_50906 [Schizophyllum commune]|nr:hypothetical protein K525DRAFT_192402 [Schizophyllum commune Loenen D]